VSSDFNSMPAGDGVALAAKILRQVLFHLGSRLVRHRLLRLGRAARQLGIARTAGHHWRPAYAALRRGRRHLRGPQVRRSLGHAQRHRRAPLPPRRLRPAPDRPLQGRIRLHPPAHAGEHQELVTEGQASRGGKFRWCFDAAIAKRRSRISQPTMTSAAPLGEGENSGLF